MTRSRAGLTAQSVPTLTATAVFAYLLASLLPGSSRPVLAPLTAILVVQATRYQTMRSAVQRVASVVAGVVVALGFTAAVGFTWWSLGLVIAVGLVIGSVLRLGEHILEVPISAMLILALGSGSAATGRIVDSLAGAAAGLAGGMIFSRVRTQPAQDAIGELSRRMAGLLDEIASGLTGGAGGDETEIWLARARSLTSDLQQVDDTLGEAEDSLRLTPSALRSDRTAAPLRNGLETLELAAVTIRGLTRSLTDDARLPERDAAALSAGTPEILANVLWRIAAAIRAYGSLIRADLRQTRGPDGDELDRHLAEAREQRDLLALTQHKVHEPASAGWQLRGEILLHLERLTSELQVERLSRARQGEATPSRLDAVRTCLLRLVLGRGTCLPGGGPADGLGAGDVAEVPDPPATNGLISPAFEYLAQPRAGSRIGADSVTQVSRGLSGRCQPGRAGRCARPQLRRRLRPESGGCPDRRHGRGRVGEDPAFSGIMSL